jgi:hypothetical protein
VPGQTIQTILMGATFRIDALSDLPASLFILLLGGATLRVLAWDKDVIAIQMPCYSKR